MLFFPFLIVKFELFYLFIHSLLHLKRVKYFFLIIINYTFLDQNQMDRLCLSKQPNVKRKKHKTHTHNPWIRYIANNHTSPS